jgi:hypothetical protein
MDSSGMMGTLDVEIGTVEVDMLREQIAVNNERIGAAQGRRSFPPPIHPR